MPLWASSVVASRVPRATVVGAYSVLHGELKAKPWEWPCTDDPELLAELVRAARSSRCDRCQKPPG